MYVQRGRRRRRRRCRKSRRLAQHTLLTLSTRRSVRIAAAHKINITLLLFQSKHIKFSVVYSRNGIQTDLEKNPRYEHYFEWIFALKQMKKIDRFGRRDDERRRRKKNLSENMEFLWFGTAFKIESFRCETNPNWFQNWNDRFPGTFKVKIIPFHHHLHSIKSICELRVDEWVSEWVSEWVLDVRLILSERIWMTTTAGCNFCFSYLFHESYAFHSYNH